MNENSVKEDEKRIIKIGRITLGIIMILFGASIFMQLVVKVNIIRYVLMLWPLVLMTLGIEILYYNNKKNIIIKYDIPGIILAFFILIFGSIFSYVSLGIDTLLNSNSNTAIVADLIDSQRVYIFDNKVKINNLTDMPVAVKIQEDKDYDGIKVKARVKYKDNINANIVTLINDKYSIYNLIDVNYNINNNDKSTSRIGKISITDKPDWLDSIELIITTNSKDNIECMGNVNIK